MASSAKSQNVLLGRTRLMKNKSKNGKRGGVKRKEKRKRPEDATFEAANFKRSLS